MVPAETGESVAESPYTLRVAAGKPDARKSTIRLIHPGAAMANQAVDFEVEARDAFGNR